MLFNEIYGNYYKIMNSIIKEAISGQLSEKKILDMVLEDGFGESLLTVPDAIKSGQWKLITPEMETPILSEPKVPLTTLEKRWLKALLSDPRIKLFDVDAAGLEDVTPLYEPDTFVYFDQYSDGDPYEDDVYVDSFKTALEALRHQKMVCVKFASRYGQSKLWNCIPISMEYSEKDDKFRLVVATGYRKSSINIARIKSIKILNDRPAEEVAIDLVPKEKLVARLRDERNALERAMLHFSTFEKETVKIGEREYTLNLYYDPEDESELLIRILQFGPFIKVEEPVAMINLIKERLAMQARYMK